MGIWEAIILPITTTPPHTTTQSCPTFMKHPGAEVQAFGNI